MGAAECDVFAIYAELRATTAERIAERNGAKTTEPGYERLRALAAQIMAEHTALRCATLDGRTYGADEHALKRR
jgi:hypothetical protein